MTFAYRSCFVGLGLGFWVACTPTKPGAHVELVHKGGQSVYVSGAAGPGISRSIACRAAIQRSVAAIAQRFAYENRQIGAKIAKEVGASDGEVFCTGTPRKMPYGLRCRMFSSTQVSIYVWRRCGGPLLCL
ncbi:MAG: hypothetical protein R3C68_14300 [Myxococcota bacterium]